MGMRSNNDIPLIWINLDRAVRLKHCMNNAIEAGGWRGYRFAAIDAINPDKWFVPTPNIFITGSKFPGGRRAAEKNPFRLTSRSELACLASWQEIILVAETKMKEHNSEIILLMEDDVGSSLAVPDEWPFRIMDLKVQADQLSSESGIPWTMVQLAPINAHARVQLHQLWEKSSGNVLLAPKTGVRSHGNGAVLLHARALKYLTNSLRKKVMKRFPGLHPLTYPYNVRPVADKWIYASVPFGSVYVVTYPIFCLEARDSDLHSEHVEAFHKPSREITLKLWQKDNATELINAFRNWESVKE
jgi:hypothetical protein